MLIQDPFGKSGYLNPHQVVTASKDGDHEYAITLSNDRTIWVNRETYERIVAWMEKHDE